MKKKAELNLIDKAIAFVNPQGAVDRLLARQKLKNFEYDAVKYSRERKGPSSLSGAEDYRSNYDRVELMKRARDLAENVGLVRSILLKFAGHVAGTISYQARTQNPQVNTDVEAYWNEWWDKCDISTRHTGSTLMQVAVMSMLRDGDFLFVLVRDSNGDLKIQGIEADRLGDPFKVYTSLELIGGIHIDRNTGAPTAYDIYNRSIGDFYSYQITIPSSQAFHLFDPLRIDQYRGVSAFHTAINDATDIHELTSFEKMAAKVASSQSGIVKRNNNNAADLSTLSTEEDISGNQIKLETIESGKISYLEPGEDIIFPNGPSRPSGAFIEFHKVLMRNICLGLGIPYSFAVDPSAMSGPTARLEMQQAGRTFKRYQNLLNDKVLRPIKNIVIADAVARGMIQTNEGGKTTRGIFNFGANVSIDLGRESASAIAEFKSGLRTGSDIYAERGADWEASMRQRAIEAKAIQDLAKEYGVPPETISDVVPPEKPAPAAPALKPQSSPKPDEDEQDDGEEPDNAPEPDEPIEPSSENLEVKKKESENPLEFLNPAELKMLIAGMMGGIELGKYDGIDFTPPQGARDAAKRALDVREGKPASQRGMTPVGIARARDLMNGVKLSPDTVRRMKAFFDRHEVDKKGATWDEQGKGWQAWNGWGGDAGYAWASKVVRQMESRDKELSTNQKDVVEFLRGRDCGQDDGGTFGPGNDCATGYGRPKQEGGYTPMRPGGKWPPGYKVGEGRPADERKQKEEQPKVKEEKKSYDPLDEYKYDKNNSAEISDTDHQFLIDNAYNETKTYESQKIKTTEDEREMVDEYRGSSGSYWTRYERLKAKGISSDEAFRQAIEGRSIGSPTGIVFGLQESSGNIFTDDEEKKIKRLLSEGNKEELGPFYDRALAGAEKRISGLDKLANSKFSEPQTVYRGFVADSEDSRNILRQVKNGKTINFETFMSASSDPTVAAGYADRDGVNEGDSILFKIKAKRGVSTINSNRPQIEKSFKEIILPKGRYKVIKQRTVKTEDSKTHFVEIEQL
jgi:lambda family phage portal protein